MLIPLHILNYVFPILIIRFLEITKEKWMVKTVMNWALYFTHTATGIKWHSKEKWNGGSLTLQMSCRFLKIQPLQSLLISNMFTISTFNLVHWISAYFGFKCRILSITTYFTYVQIRRNFDVLFTLYAYIQGRIKWM